MGVKKTGLSIILFFITALFVLISCSRGSDASTGASKSIDDEAARSIAVEGMNATKGRLVAEILGTGTAEGIREAWVVSETEGLIRSVLFDFGDNVTEGQILLTVDSDSAERDRDLAEQRHTTALLEYNAAEKSRENGSISELQYSRTADALLAAESARAEALDAFEKTRLTAPFSGAVAAKSGDIGIGNYLARGIRVVKIVDDSAFRTVIGVGEGQVLLLREGSAAYITGNDGVTRLGSVAAISAGSDDATGSFVVVIEWIPQPGDALKSGMSVRVAIEATEIPKRIIVPAYAIFQRRGAEFVYIASDGRAELREIRTGSRLGERVEVLDGLQEGDIILTSGLASLAQGLPVKITMVGNTDAAR